MKKLVAFLVSLPILASCSNEIVSLTDLNLQDQKITALSDIPVPEFNKKKLGIFNVPPTNSISEQKKKQIKLHSYYFRAYSNGSTSYSSSDTNEHMKMLRKAEESIKKPLDSNNDSRITLDEINNFVTSQEYIVYFRTNYVNFSFSKLDGNSDKKLVMDEFGEFNKKIKAKEVRDFQLLEEFSDFDYNSNRSLDIEEYEDFFMKYLLIKVGAEK
jgi:hypothetical protein